MTTDPLIRVRELLADQDRYTSKTWSTRGKTGTVCHPNDPGAGKWSLPGALEYLGGRKAFDASVITDLDHVSLEYFGQDHAVNVLEHGDVLRLLDMAIEYRRTKPVEPEPKPHWVWGALWMAGVMAMLVLLAMMVTGCRWEPDAPIITDTDEPLCIAIDHESCVEKDGVTTCMSSPKSCSEGDMVTTTGACVGGDETAVCDEDNQGWAGP